MKLKTDNTFCIINFLHAVYSTGRLSLGCPVLNGLLHGGLLVPGVNEIAGVSASGKTQLCLQLCLTVQLPRELGGLEGGEWL